MSNEEDHRERETKVMEFLKKVVSSGASTNWLTEDMIKGIVPDLKIPKEFLGQITQGAKKTKNDIISVVGNEVKSHLQSLDWSKLLEQLMKDYDLEIKMNLKFKKKKKSSHDNKSEET